MLTFLSSPLVVFLAPRATASNPVPHITFNTWIGVCVVISISLFTLATSRTHSNIFVLILTSGVVLVGMTLIAVAAHALATGLGSDFVSTGG